MGSLPPGETAVFSWVDPERPKGKRIVCCHLDLPDLTTGQLRTEERLEIDFDKAEYSRSFGGAVPPPIPVMSLRTPDARWTTQPQAFSRQQTVRTAGADNSLYRSSRMLLHLTVEAEGCTKTLRLVESTGEVLKPGLSVRSLSRTTELVRAESKRSSIVENRRSVAIADAEDFERLRTSSRLESLDDPDVLYEVERKQPEQERKFQLDIGTI